MEIKKHPHIGHGRSKAIVTFETPQETNCFDMYSYGSGSIREWVRRSLVLYKNVFVETSYPHEREIPMSVIGHVAFVAANRSKPSRDPDTNIAANEILRATTYYLQEQYHDITAKSSPIEQEPMSGSPATESAS